jgi:hypothetical protein
VALDESIVSDVVAVPDFVVGDFVVEDFVVEDFVVEDLVVEDFVVEDFVVVAALVVSLGSVAVSDGVVAVGVGVAGRVAGEDGLVEEAVACGAGASTVTGASSLTSVTVAPPPEAPVTACGLRVPAPDGPPVA